MEMQHAAHGSRGMQQVLVVVHGKLFVTNVREIKVFIFVRRKYCKLMRHVSIHRILTNIRRQCFWSNLELDVDDYV